MDAKYYAGLYDADGSFSIQARKLANGNFKIQPRAVLTQLTFRDKPLRDLQREFGGTLYTDKHEEHKGWQETTVLVMTCAKALRLMEHLKKHLVIKKEIVDFIQNVSGKEVNQDVLNVVKKSVKELRYEIHPLRTNQPSRRWIAGYVDGDGCLRAQVSKRGYLKVRLEITSYDRDTQGVELLQKAFGGSINKHGKNAIRWVLYITESNAQKVLGCFVRHSKIKQDQVQYALNFLNNGKHLRNRGATLESNTEFKETLSAMKQPQRLSESGLSGNDNQAIV